MGTDMIVITAMLFIGALVLVSLHEMWADSRDKKWKDFIEFKAIPKIGLEIQMASKFAIECELDAIPEKLKDIRKEMEE